MLKENIFQQQRHEMWKFAEARRQELVDTVNSGLTEMEQRFTHAPYQMLFNTTTALDNPGEKIDTETVL